MTPLTDAELELLHKLTVVSWPDNASRGDAELQLARSVPRLLAEVRAARALLATPMPKGYDEPRVVVERGHGSIDVVHHAGVRYEPDEAVALGAALVRVGLAAKGETT